MKHLAWITRDWETDGLAWVVVARERGGDELWVGAFLIDPWCLGVKHAWGEGLLRADLDEVLDTQIPVEMREPIDPACAKKFVEGAMAYAQSLGFLPHRDFRKARKALSGIDAAACPREFTFGCDGQPRFVIGPDDDDARIDRVLAVLSAKLGVDGFTVEEIDDGDDGDDEAPLNMMFRFVESPHCPDRALSGFVVSGFAAAAVMVDPARECDEWWTELFGGMKPELPDDETYSPEGIRQGFVDLCDDTRVRFAADEWTPFLPPLDQPDHFSAAAEYCRGFLRVLDARPAVLELLGSSPAALAQLALLRRQTEPGDVGSGGEGATGRRDVIPKLTEALRVLLEATASLRPDGDEIFFP